jgi:bifunctional enzyme CysN/CysC
MSSARPSTSLLRVATAGSVDDGKSTLIGRLLYDSKSIFDDQLDALQRTSTARGEAGTNLALLTDGLRAEREQGITIDVAYRYFATPRRSFILADTPGHVHYTRNMVTGASTADLALILVDARLGVSEQTRRHAFLASLLRVPHLTLCVNKMDLVGWNSDVYYDIRADFVQFAAKLDIGDLTFVPVSALHGDNVVQGSTNMPWFEGAPLLHHLEEVHIGSDRNLIDTRMPVQYVIRDAPRSVGDPHQSDFRGYAGQVASGAVHVGDEVVVLPAGRHTTISNIDAPDGPVDVATPPQSVVVRFADDLDVSRGDMICRPHNRAQMGTSIDATLCWFDEATQLQAGRTYAIMHCSRWVRGRFDALHYRLDVNTLHRDTTADSLRMNDIGRVVLHTTRPLMFDEYRRNRATGRFIVVDEHTNATVAAGMILGAAPGPGATNVTFQHGSVTTAQRWQAIGHRGATLWLTGLPGAGKSTVAMAVEAELLAAGRPAMVLDGDNLRHGLNADLGFSDRDRAENVRRVSEVAQMLNRAGIVAIVSLISPLRATRDAARHAHQSHALPFAEVFVDVPLEVCEQRDPKGLYARARAGEIPDLTGVGSPYEAPLSADLVIGSEGIDVSVADVLGLLGRLDSTDASGG